ncbi:MAG TPA: hypothetical protein VNP97_05735 [Microbacterium sp.]|nr:hypothetical protein [Microbacterium sp.]
MTLTRAYKAMTTIEINVGTLGHPLQQLLGERLGYSGAIARKSPAGRQAVEPVEFPNGC